MATGYVQLKREACAGVLQQLRGVDAHVLFALISYTNKHGVCHPSLETLARDTHHPAGSVGRSLLMLETLGLLDRQGPTSKERFTLTEKLMGKPGKKTASAEITGDRSAEGRPVQDDGPAGSLVISKTITGDLIRRSTEEEERQVPVVLKREKKKRKYSGRRKSRKEVEVEQSVVEVPSNSRYLRGSTEGETTEAVASMSSFPSSDTSTPTTGPSSPAVTSQSHTLSVIEPLVSQNTSMPLRSSSSPGSVSPTTESATSGASLPLFNTTVSERPSNPPATASPSTNSVFLPSSKHKTSLSSSISTQTTVEIAASISSSASPSTSTIPSTATSTSASKTLQAVPPPSIGKITTADQDWSSFLLSPRTSLTCSLTEHIVRSFQRLPQYTDDLNSRDSRLHIERQFIKNLVEPSLDVTTLTPDSFVVLLVQLRDLDHDAILRGEARRLLTPYCPGDNIFALKDKFA